MPNYFRKLQFQTVDGQQVDWDLSYLCDVTNGTVYTFYFDTAFTGTLTNLKMPVIDGTSLKYLTYTNYKTDIVNDVKDWIENNQSFIDAIIVNGSANNAVNAEKTSFDNNNFSTIDYNSTTGSFTVGQILPINTDPWYGVKNFQLKLYLATSNESSHKMYDLGVHSIDLSSTTTLYIPLIVDRVFNSGNLLEIRYHYVNLSQAVLEQWYIEFVVYAMNLSNNSFTQQLLNSKCKLYIKRID